MCVKTQLGQLDDGATFQGVCIMSHSLGGIYIIPKKNRINESFKKKTIFHLKHFFSGKTSTQSYLISHMLSQINEKNLM